MERNKGKIMIKEILLWCLTALTMLVATTMALSILAVLVFCYM